ncbi:antibiotic biosynthesis monooxygenase [Salinadaptatus halalkaliphilus]|uniref:Antibiotic biosynthesis monooxygenase n=1 Tax=Salinadaptatus halalkaliphilus TaxID=2419781 RepID=A0A4S3TP49_9EURY|nr:putative quinol monooxygenase [Salinadaptatus halalkaliphilus]THE65986.1 antibiotic biosynthesis monooxygenase [Salinadaptatus halalkaliphilus]
MIVINATLPIDPDQRDQALELIQKTAAQYREDDGTIEFQASTDIDNPNHVNFFECYEDEAALEQHRQSDHYEEFGRSIAEFLVGKPEITRYDVESTTEIEV